MARLTGLFKREGVYYLRVILPEQHPLRSHYKSGKVVNSLGQCTLKDALRLGTLRRAKILWGTHESPAAEAAVVTHTKGHLQTIYPADSATLREVFEHWAKAIPRTRDSVAACERALKLYEQHSTSFMLSEVTRAKGIDFRTVLLSLPTTTKTARDRLNWMKGLIKYAAQEMELLAKNPWEGLEIKNVISSQRQCWTKEHIETLINNEIWQKGSIPTHKKSGGIAAYWIPLLGLYTGARLSELCQLKMEDIETNSEIPMIKIHGDGVTRTIKTQSSNRQIPIHEELIKLGFLTYVRSISSGTMWPDLMLRNTKPGGYFSQWFTTLRRSINIPDTIDFHSFRHTVRTSLVNANIAEPIIDTILGHKTRGSIGARYYTHLSKQDLQRAINTLSFRPATHTKIKKHQ